MNDAQRTCLLKHGTLVGRILLGLLFFVSGMSMLTGEYGVGGVGQMIAGMGLPLAGLLAWVVVATKIIAGGALMVGYRVEYAAAALVVFTALTIVFVHNNMGELTAALKNLSIIGGLLYVMAFGPGKGWSITKSSEEAV